MGSSYKFEGWLGNSPESAAGKMEWAAFEPKVFTEEDVDIKVSHCGVCGTDVHMLQSEWGPTRYPCCPGHEITGHVVKVGQQVKHLKVGDRVGVGAIARTCNQADCFECSSGQNNFCPRLVTTYGSIFPNNEGTSYGGYANYHRTNGGAVYKIPDALPLADAASMLCAGITVYSPLKKYAGAGKKVGIVGIGGLGHFGLLFAKALGCDSVVAISRSSAKRKDAFNLGADKYIATGEDPNWAGENERTLDAVISTAELSSDATPYLQLLKTGGTFVTLALGQGGAFPPFNGLGLLFKGLRIVGTVGGDPKDMNEMLQLAAEKQIKPWIQKIPIESANKALVEMATGSPRYRLVLVNEEE